MATLLPCPRCARHVRAIETACPFCHASLASIARAALQRPGERLGRGAMFAFRAAVAASVSLTGCAETATPGDDAGVQIDARPVTDAAADSEAPEDADALMGDAAPVYGGPPDAGD